MSRCMCGSSMRAVFRRKRRGFTVWHVPLEQVPPVQGSPFMTGVELQPVPELEEQMSAVHSFESLHVPLLGAKLHPVAALQVSVVHDVMSLHMALFGLN